MKRIVSSLKNTITLFSPRNAPIDYIDFNEKVILVTPQPAITKSMIKQINDRKITPERTLRILGPIYINGAKRGDVIKVEIKTIELDNRGKSWYGDWIGILKDCVHESYLREFYVEDEFIMFDSKRMPARPMIGTVGVSPDFEVSCLEPGTFGGNMDIPTLTVGSSLYLKLFNDGALLSVGDVHAIMGYGEVLGTGIEIGSNITICVEKHHDNTIPCPLHETNEGYDVIASEKTVDSAIKSATKNAVKLVSRINNISFSDAYMLTGEFCDLHISQVVNPSVTVFIHIPKCILNRTLNELSN